MEPKVLTGRGQSWDREKAAAGLQGTSFGLYPEGSREPLRNLTGGKVQRNLYLEKPVWAGKMVRREPDLRQEDLSGGHEGCSEET